MTSESRPERRHHYGWWIAGGVCASLFGLSLYIWVNYGGAIQTVYSVISGKPSFPGCERTATREAHTGSLWYRVIEMRCPDNGSISLLYVKQPQGPFSQLAFLSMNGPAAVSVRETENRGFEMVLAAPPAQAVTSPAIAQAENGPSVRVCGLEVRPEFTPLSEISPHFIDALIAAEDPNFYTHTPWQAARFYYEAIREPLGYMAKLPNGIDIISLRLIRCAYRTGGITKRIIGVFDNELLRLIPIEIGFSKSTILQLYVNQAYLGRNKYGVSAASQAYFGKQAKDLTLAEAAFLAGIPEETFTAYRRGLKRDNRVLELLDHKLSSAQREAAYGLERRNEILDAMAQAGKITAMQAEAAKAEPLGLRPGD